MKLLVINSKMTLNCQTSDLGLRLEVDFVFPLSQQEQQQEQEQQEQEPSPKYTERKGTIGL